MIKNSEMIISELKNIIYYQHDKNINSDMRNINYVSNHFSEYQLIILMYLNSHSTL